MMKSNQSQRTGQGLPLRLMARLFSLVVNSVFLLILVLALANEDRPQGPAITILILLVLTMAASFAAWRWAQAGGIAVIAGALGTGLAAYLASLSFGLGSQSFLIAIIYGAPFLVTGLLFWASGRFEVAGAPD